MDKKICVIGGGAWGENIIRTLFELEALGAVVEPGEERRKYLSEKYCCVGFAAVEEAIEKRYDGYVVSAPAELHYEIGRKTLSAGLPTIIEKPLTLNSQDALRLVQLAEEKKVPFMVAHILLFHPAIRKIKELVDEGRIGKLFYMYSTRIKFGVVRTEENVFWSFAPHDIAVLDYIAGAHAEKIETTKGNFLQNDVCDYAMAQLEYPNNVKAHILTSWLHPFKEQRVVVVGSEGMLWFEDATDKQVYFSEKHVEWEDGRPQLVQGDAITIPYEKTLPLTEEMKYFIAHLDKMPEMSTGRAGYEVVKVLENVVG